MQKANALSVLFIYDVHIHTSGELTLRLRSISVFQFNSFVAFHFGFKNIQKKNDQVIILYSVENKINKMHLSEK